jgi:threonine/homoserine/homoserine lactone efflux protein
MKAEVLLIIRAIWVGLISGYLLALPTGPAGLESIRWTLNHGFRKGMTVALGALSADVLDIVLINHGLLELIRLHYLLEVAFWLLFGTIVLIIGLGELKKARQHEQSDLMMPHLKEDKKQPAYLTGFLMTLTYPGTHFFWLTLGSTVIQVWRPLGKPAYYTFQVALMAGMVLALATLNWLAMKGKRFAAPKIPAKFTALIPYGIAVLGAGFIITGLVRFTMHFYHA